MEAYSIGLLDIESNISSEKKDFVLSVKFEFGLEYESKTSAFNLFCVKYSILTSVISNSPLLEGLIFLDISITSFL